MQGSILDAVRQRFEHRADQQQLTWLLAVQCVREFFDDKSIEWSFYRGILKIKTDRHDVIMRLFSHQETIIKLIYQKRWHYNLPTTPIRKIIGK